MFTNIDKSIIIQDTKLFNESPLKAQKCAKVLTKLLFLIYQGETFSQQDATNAFFAITKAFQSKDVGLRRLVYLTIKELAGMASDIMMVISSLTQDMNNLPQCRANAVRTLGSVVDSTMISGVERVLKQAIGDGNPSVVSCALTTAVYFYSANRDAVKRWLPEVQAALHAASVDKSIAQYHSLGLLYLIKQNDQMAISKLVQQIHAKPANMLATCLNLRIYSHFLQSSIDATRNGPHNGGGSLPTLDLKPFLRFKGKSDMVALEAARVICDNCHIYSDDIVFAITTLQMFLTSPKALLRFAAIRALSDFVPKARDNVAICNVEIEALVSDPNRHIATLAITTLLKTGNEASVDRLMGPANQSQILAYVSEISDDFKIVIVDAVKSLGLKFPKKYKSMLLFLGNVLREDGGYAHKEATVDAICQLLAQIPEAREPALAHLCEFIEDCEYPQLTANILHLIGEEGCKGDSPAKFVRYIYNRLILEDADVRVAAVGALVKLATSCSALKSGIVSILTRSLDDDDDEVRDRAVLGMRILDDSSACVPGMHSIDLDYFCPPASEEDTYDLEAMEGRLLNYLRECSSSASPRDPFDIYAVPKMAKAAQFAQARSAKIAASSTTPSLSAKMRGSSSAASSSTSLNSATQAGHTTSRKEDHLSMLGRISQVPQFAAFGSVIHATGSVPLTEPGTEYVVHACKHIFARHLVIEFDCRNTVNELVLENVTVRLLQTSGNGDGAPSIAALRPLFAVPIERLVWDEPQSCYVAYEFDPTTHQEVSFASALSFTAVEVDTATGECIGRGSQDEYAMESLDFTMSDYVKYRHVADFPTDWDRLSYQIVETFELQAMRTIDEAVSAVAQLVGVRAYQNSDRVAGGSTVASTHTMHITASLVACKAKGSPSAVDDVPFSIRARFALVNLGVAVEICVRSEDASVSSLVAGMIC